MHASMMKSMKIMKTKTVPIRPSVVICGRRSLTLRMNHGAEDGPEEEHARIDHRVPEALADLRARD